MNLADELTKLNELRFSGVLSDAEFEKAKAALLNPTRAAPEHAPEQIAAVRYETELARLDREWEMERQQYLIRNQYGIRQLPTTGIGIAMAGVGGVFGTLWTIVAFAITRSAPDVGPFPIVNIRTASKPTRRGGRTSDPRIRAEAGLRRRCHDL